MPLISTKLAFRGGSVLQRISVEGIYFKTFPYGLDLYTQESFFGRLTGTHEFGAAYRLHASVGYQYFIDDSRPYSLRLDSGNQDRFNLSFGLLHEIHFFRRAGIFLETALLGLNYVSPYLHVGASAFYEWSWGVLQLGLSRSTSLADSEDWTVHPEAQIQTFF
jgi:hypothetical protein